MELGKSLLESLLAIQRENAWSETMIASEIGVTSAVWGNWKARGGVSKDGLEKVLVRFPEAFIAYAGAQFSSPDPSSSSRSAGATKVIRAVEAADSAGAIDAGGWKIVEGMVTALARKSEDLPFAAADQHRIAATYQRAIADGDAAPEAMKFAELQVDRIAPKRSAARKVKRGRSKN